MIKTQKTVLFCLLFHTCFGIAGGKEITFSENLRFGASDDPVYIWPDSRVSLSVDNKGFIYVSDISESRVLRFDENGLFVDVVIQKGKGPNELEALTNFQVLNDGSCRAYQYQGRTGLLKIFDQNLQFQKSLQGSDMGVPPMAIKWSPNGGWAAIEYNERDNQTHSIITHVGLLNQQMELHKSFSSTLMPLPSQEKMNQRDFWVSFFKNISQLYFQNRTLLAFDQKGRIYVAESESYTINRWNAAFDAIEQTYQKSIEKRPWKPVDLEKLATEISQQYTEGYPPAMKRFLTPEIVLEGLQQADISGGRNPLLGLILSDDDKLLVVLDEERSDQSQVAEVFHPDGSYIGRLYAPNKGLIDGNNQTRMLFKGPNAYTIETVEEGVHQVVRYTVNWNPKTKP